MDSVRANQECLKRRQEHSEYLILARLDAQASRQEEERKAEYRRQKARQLEQQRTLMAKEAMRREIQEEMSRDCVITPDWGSPTASAIPRPRAGGEQHGGDGGLKLIKDGDDSQHAQNAQSPAARPRSAGPVTASSAPPPQRPPSAAPDHTASTVPRAKEETLASTARKATRALFGQIAHGDAEMLGLSGSISPSSTPNMSSSAAGTPATGRPGTVPVPPKAGREGVDPEVGPLLGGGGTPRPFSDTYGRNPRAHKVKRR